MARLASWQAPDAFILDTWYEGDTVNLLFPADVTFDVTLTDPGFGPINWNELRFVLVQGDRQMRVAEIDLTFQDFLDWATSDSDTDFSLNGQPYDVEIGEINYRSENTGIQPGAAELQLLDVNSAEETSVIDTKGVALETDNPVPTFDDVSVTGISVRNAGDGAVGGTMTVQTGVTVGTRVTLVVTVTDSQSGTMVTTREFETTIPGAINLGEMNETPVEFGPIDLPDWVTEVEVCAEVSQAGPG